ncbi:flagellar hook-basal body complex protein FliE [Fredinandcohnia quinoae]|uniref:Flagellar hook-basal body complex protein FliE n=1 Tax=Fredinandcohnia quinoae TaxID=2918902 RepID=A0AAW5DUR8_9BACI|nr:flagellar hook-basal body complex protein FliE [Fredinandcohnia sp. SECRCQ15]MCH1623788.1 flagellar hook-basal body complex protein FliE [Fredinandcohnia sp. SECRCQ15]
MIDKINSTAPQIFNKTSVKLPSANESHANFGTFLKDALNNVNKAQNNSDIMTQKLINGENVELHQVMIASEKASVSLQATLEIRNKVIEAYQEIMRMQV